ncbi:MAG: diguanylate cyclase with sensor [Cyanobacteria bacterium RYN_339]|nr:diguanylate cyclase with sensor [Cyanobacteria bacterium RYN_339]
MKVASSNHPLLGRLSSVFFGLISLVGTCWAGYIVISDSGLLGIMEALRYSGASGNLWGHVVEAARRSVLGIPTLYMLMALGVVAELTNIPLPKGGRMTAGFLICFATLLMLGLPACLIVVAFVAVVVAGFPPKGKPTLALFNIGQYSLAYLAANYALSNGHVYIYGFPGPDDNTFVAFATGAYLLVNFIIVDTYLALKKGISPLRILWEDDRTEILVTVALAPMALLMAYMHKEQGWMGASLVLIPMFATAYGVYLFLKVKQSEQALAEYNEQLTILQQVATRISSQIDLDATLTMITYEMHRVVGYDDCMIFLLDEKTNMLVRQLTNDPAQPRTPLKLPLEHGVFGEVASEKRTIMKVDLAAESLDVGVLSGFRSLLAVPVVTEQQVLGVLALLHQEPSAFDPGDERLLSILASQAAVAIKNAQLYRATQQLAVTDGLTKIFNRRYFEEQLTAELARAKRHGHTTSLILLDVDHFKKFNDTHGHLLGDQVLQGVARVLQQSTRETDLVARYGGEEFVVILPETPPAAALEVAERIRRNVKSHPFWGRGQTPLQVTISLGLSSDPSSAIAPKAFIDSSDICLYQAKKQGRDRVCQTVYKQDEPQEITESRNETAPEPTLRKPTRSVATLSSDEWQRYLHGNLDATFQQWWDDPRVNEVLGDARPFWRQTAGDFVDVLLQKLGSTEEQRNAWLERFQRHPLYRPVQAELSKLIQHGVTITQMEYAILGFYKKMQSAVQGAPFSLEERMTVGSIQERLFHVLQLMVTQVWHDFYQATSEHLYLVSELETRLTVDLEQEAVLAEIASITARALGGDACLVLTPDAEGTDLLVRASWGMDGLGAGDSVPIDASLLGTCFRTQEVHLVPAWDDEAKLNQGFLKTLRAVRPVESGLMVPLVYQDLSLGVLYCLSEQREHFSPLDVRLGKGIGGRLATALERQRQEVKRQASYLESVAALAEALETRITAKGGRSDKLLDYALGLANVLNLPAHQREHLIQAGRLHDIGELGIPDAVLGKAGPLDAGEKALVRNHPLTGARILGYIEALRDIVPIVRHHHERVDGSGYPDGLKGQDIPLLARILSVADAFDAMTTARPYRQAMTPDQALHELRRSGHFDVSLIDHLAQLVAVQESLSKTVLQAEPEEAKSAPPG